MLGLIVFAWSVKCVLGILASGFAFGSWSVFGLLSLGCELKLGLGLNWVWVFRLPPWLLNNCGEFGYDAMRDSIDDRACLFGERSFSAGLLN